MKQLMLGVTETTGGKYWQMIKNSACSISNNALGSGTDANLCTSQLQVHQSASEGKVVIQYRIKWVRKKNLNYISEPYWVVSVFCHVFAVCVWII